MPLAQALSRVAGSLPSAPTAALYGDEAAARVLRERVLARTWHLVASTQDLPEVGDVLPVTLLPGCLDEPILLVRTADGIHGYSNVCTHRGAILVEHACKPGGLRCPYHGRRFGLDGRLRHAPEFERTPGFPTAEDDLPRVSVGTWGPFVFAALDPVMPFDQLVAPLEERMGWLRGAHLTRDIDGERTFDVNAAWPLWCDNYLEGLHVPWVHPALARALDWKAYRTETTAWGVTQVGIAAPGDAAFTPPVGHPDAGQRVAAWYFWLFPLTTLNFYPWGVSVNVLQPEGAARTRILYQSWVRDPSLRAAGAGGALDEVEAEDDAIIERVQRGVRSRLYRGGRYAVGWEEGVQHFHRLVAGML